MYGVGTLSSALSVLCADVPDTMVAPTTSLSSTNAVITWAAPSNQGSAITAYEVQLYHSLSYFTDSTYCPSGVSLTCSIPMSNLVSTYGYSIGDLV